MAGLNDARKAIYDKFVTDWADETIFDFDNEDFEPPNGDTPWVRLVVRNRLGRQESLGAIGQRKFLREAAVIVQVFVPLDKGLSEADRLATKVRDIFEGTRLSGLWFFTSDIVEIGPDGKFYQYNVECVFNYEQTK